MVVDYTDSTNVVSMLVLFVETLAAPFTLLESKSGTPYHETRYITYNRTTKQESHSSGCFLKLRAPASFFLCHFLCYGYQYGSKNAALFKIKV